MSLLKTISVIHPSGSTTNITNDASGNVTVGNNLTVTGTLTGSTGVMNIGSGQLYKDGSGFVGIGTSSPSAKLQVQGSQASGTANVLYLDNSSATGTTLASVSFSNSGSVKASIAACVAGDGYMTFSNNNNTEKMRIDAAGNLLVGKTTTAETTVGACFSVSANNIGLSSGNYFIVNYVPGGSSTMIDFRTGGVSKGSISQNGSNVAYNTSSDYRLKNSVAPITSGLATVAALKPVTYKWNADESDGEGFIAHELQEVIPHAVAGEKDAVNEDGSIKPQGVDYSKIVVHLVAAIQEQQAAITALTARLAALEAK